MKKTVLSLMSLICAVSLSLGIGFGVKTTAKAETPTVSFNDFVSDFTLENATVTQFGGNKMPQFNQSNAVAVPTTNEYETNKEAYNQTMTIRYNNPIYLKDNGTDTPFIAFSTWSNTVGTRDYDAIIFTLTDANNPDNHVSIMLGMWQDNNFGSTMYAKGTGQKFRGYHASATSKWLNGDLGTEQGTIIPQTFVNDGAMGKTIWLYYDTASKSVYTYEYWSSYSSRPMTFVTNSSNDKLVCVRDLTDTASEGADSVAFDAEIESAYLSITTVRGWLQYTDEFGETNSSSIYSKSFRGGSSSGHTLSDKGAIFGIRELDGVPLNFSSGSIASTGTTVYTAGDYESEQEAVIPALYAHNAITGVNKDAAYTANLYVKVENAGGENVAINGLAGGKWAEGCYFNAPAAGIYTVKYCSDAEFNTVVASAKCEVKILKPDMDNLVVPPAASEYFEGAGMTAELGNFKSGNSAENNGLILTFTNGNHAVYKKNLKAADLTKDVALIEFMPLQSSYDFRQFHIRLVDKNDPEVYFTVDFLYDGGQPNLTGVLAAGNNQQPYGLKYIRENNEFNSGYLAQDFKGVPTSGTYSLFGLYYDTEENCVYASPTYSWNGTASGKAKLRDFDSDEIRTRANGSAPFVDPEEPFWNGFTSEEVTLEVWVTNISSGVSECNIGITCVAGERISQKLNAEAITKAVVGYEYEIPVPTYFNNEKNAFENFNESKYTLVKVVDEAENEVPVTGGKFTPTEEGFYKIIYAVREGETSYGYELSVTVMSAASADKIVFDGSASEIADGASVYLGNTLDGTLTASTELILKEDKSLGVVTNLYKDNVLVKTFAAGETVSVDCDSLGVYKLVYSATDYVGRTQDKEITFTVTRTYTAFKNAADAVTEFDITDGVLTLGKDDIVVEDINYDGGNEVKTLSKDFFGMDVNIYVKYQDGDYVAYTDSYDMTRVGAYTVKYAVVYRLTDGGDEITAEILRTVNAIDNSAPIFDTAVSVTGAKVNEDKTDGVWFMAIKDGAISVTVPAAHDTVAGASKTIENITVTFTDAQNEVTDVTNQVSGGVYTFTATEKGTYYVVFKASDGTWETTLTYAFEVKNIWLNVSLPADYEAADVGVSYALAQPVITDYDGAAVTDATVTVKALYTETQFDTVTGYNWIPSVKGAATVVYTVEKDGETVTAERSVTVLDRIKPVISFESEPETTGKVGETYVLPNVVITDNSDSGLAYKVYLVFGEEVKELSDISFIPEKEGVYTLRIECTDTSGNTATKEVGVEIIKEKSKGCKGSVLGVIPGSVCVLAIAAVALLKKKKEY